MGGFFRIISFAAFFLYQDMLYYLWNSNPQGGTALLCYVMYQKYLHEFSYQEGLSRKIQNCFWGRLLTELGQPLNNLYIHLLACHPRK